MVLGYSQKIACHRSTCIINSFCPYRPIAEDSKNAHLLALEGAEERLSLCRADVLDYDSLRAAFRGCHGVFHVASPVSNDPVSVFFVCSS
jgi:nucleoside-diphosphate-sugar epimerase